MILLDTNVLSALMRQEPDIKVVEWLNRQPRHSIWTTSITVLEIRFGLQIMEPGKRQALLRDAFQHLLTEMLQQRVANFDSAAAQHTANVMAVRQKDGRAVELRDAMIAGIALGSRATVATRNIKHFEGLAFSIVNPWAS